MTCKRCQRKVGETFKAKWNHMTKYHPDVPIKALVEMLANPTRAYGFGELLGAIAKRKLGGGE